MASALLPRPANWTAPEPLLAIGMMTRVDMRMRRQQVRATMLAPLPRGVLFKFVVGRSAGTFRSVRDEMREHSDLVRINATDRGNEDCECAEKRFLWLQHAMSRHPLASARFFGATQDDTYVQLHVLAAELQQLHEQAWQNVVYGYLSLAVLPTRPVAAGLVEQRPFVGGCGPLVNECGSFEAAQRAEGCVLGDIEGSYSEPTKWTDSWWTRVATRCGLASRNTFAPSPTAPLQVIGADAATALFEGCAYAREYLRGALAASRRSRCVGPEAHLSFAPSYCEGLLGHFAAVCLPRATFVHTTRTKSHDYSPRAAGSSWMAPHNLSLAVSFLRAAPDAPSGPFEAAGGEWAHAHEAARRSRRPEFPSLVFAARRSPSAHGAGIEIRPADGQLPVHNWYAETRTMLPATLLPLPPC